ncbi:MAG: DUF262 domain-containing protein [Chitinophagaceae bacterium]|nr:DUF262 domain-containing protein [Chitinophagaceae bacterium]
MSINKTTMRVTSKPTTLPESDLKEVTLQVPLYQREYSWDLEQISDLYYDIYNSTEESPHYLGSILVFDTGTVQEIIDGQQRITTIFLILNCIKKILIENIHIDDERIRHSITIIENYIYKRRSNKASNIDTSTEPRLITSKRDKVLFKAIMQGTESNLLGSTKEKKIKSHKLLLNANEAITKKIASLFTTEGVNGLTIFLDKVIGCLFIVMTAEKKEDEVLLFKTLNSRGIELSESDLVKNEICNNVKVNNNKEYDDAKIQEAVDIWDDMRTKLEKNKVNIDYFIFYYINSRDYSQQLRKEINSKFTTEKQNKDELFYPAIPEKLIFTAYESLIRGTQNTLELLEGLNKSADKYIEIYAPDEFLDKETKKENKSYTFLRSIRDMNITKCYPLLLRGSETLSTKNFDKLTKYVECLSFRHYILKRDPKELEKFYYELTAKLKTDLDIETILDAIKQHSSIKDEDRYMNEFILCAPKSSISKMILTRLVNKQEGLPHNHNDVHMDHIMPQKPTGTTAFAKLKKDNSENYENLNNRLGNLTLIKKKINISLSNKDFHEKKIGYKETRLKINDPLLNLDSWEFNNIEERQKALYELAKDIWVL